ncbi:fimbria/pilus outer membrane usher protein, partial [Escherichia coli]
THQGYRERDKRFHDYWNDRDDDELAPLDLNTWDAVRAARPRNTFNLNLNQRLADGWGTLYFSGTQRDYWSDTNKSREYQLGYSNAFARVSYNISASRVRNSDRKEETRFYLSLS